MLQANLLPMLDTVKQSLWTQFGASIDMLRNAITRWPDEHWDTDRRFFYTSYHTLIFLDYYLTIPPPPEFVSPLPFTLTEPENIPADALDDVIPDRFYTKTELLGYLEICREKCRQTIASLTPEKIKDRWKEDSGDMDYAFLEMLLYNMRHVQHHAAQLNVLLRHRLGDAPRWVARAAGEL